MSRCAASSSVVGLRIRLLREQLCWSQERLGVAIGIDESSARARISRYELGVHEPPLPTVRLIAEALGVSLTYLYCEDDLLALLLLRLHQVNPTCRAEYVQQFLAQIDSGDVMSAEQPAR